MFVLMLTLVSGSLAGTTLQDDRSISVRYDEGVIFEAPRYELSLKLNGWVSSRYRLVPDSEKALRSAGIQQNSAFLNDGARLWLEGSYLTIWKFRLETDFTADSNLKDAYVELAAWHELAIRIGQFKMPFSLEQLTADHLVPAISRTAAGPLTPGRDIGAMFHGLLGELVKYELAIFNGNGLNPSSITDSDYETAARLGVNFSQTEETTTYPYDAYFGVAYTSGDTDNVTTVDLTAPDTDTKVVDFFNANTATFTTIDGRKRLGVETELVFRSMGVRAEIYRVNLDLVRGFTSEENLAFKQLYVLFDFMVTGEKVAFGRAVKPKETFDPVEGGTGAVELVVKFGTFNADDEIKTSGLAVSASTTEKTKSTTIGVNWYPAMSLRFALNVTRNQFSDDLTASGKNVDSETGYLFLFQIAF